MIDVKLVVDKIEHKVVLIVGDARDVLEYFLETFLQKPLVGSLLNLNEVRHIDYFINLAEAHALGTSQHDGFDINHMRIHSFDSFTITTGTEKDIKNRS